MKRRPPQGRPVRVVEATEGPRPAHRGPYADFVLVRAASSAQAGAVRSELRALAAEYGRDPERPRVLVSLVADRGDGEQAAEPGHGGGGPRSSRRARSTAAGPSASPS